MWARRIGEQRVAYAVLALAYALVAVLILSWGKDQSFVNDEWNYLVIFRGWSFETLIHPQNGHLVALPLILYKWLAGTFGTDSHLPYQVATIVLHLVVSTIFFALVRPRLPLVVAVALTLMVVFFGVGWDTLMGAYELPNLSGMAAGLGMLLALRRCTRGGDIAACILLACSLASFSVGIAFALGALVSILLGGRAEWRRAWVVLIPGIAYAVWFVWARKFGQSEVTTESISSLLSGSADQLAAICAGITGLFRVPGTVGLPEVLEFRSEWGYPLALVFAGLVAIHVRRAPRSIYFWTIFTTLIFYFVLVAVGLSPARSPEASRYIYMGGIITLLLVAELAGDVKWSTPVALVAVAIFALALMANAANLRAGGHLFEAEGQTNRATLAALDLDRNLVDRNLLAEDGESTVYSHPDMLFPIWAYFDMADDTGTPAYGLEELMATAPQARMAADDVLVRTLGIAAEPVRVVRVDRGAAPPELFGEAEGHARTLGACVALVPELGRTATFTLGIPPGGFGYKTAPSATVAIKLGRFADETVIELPPVRGSAEVAIPRDAATATIPWRAEVRTDARTLACAR